jgi:hypothetical protein
MRPYFAGKITLYDCNVRTKGKQNFLGGNMGGEARARECMTAFTCTHIPASVKSRLLQEEKVLIVYHKIHKFNA